MNDSNGVDEENDDGDTMTGSVCPEASDVRDALQVLRDYMPFSLNGEYIEQSSTHLLWSLTETSLLN